MHGQSFPFRVKICGVTTPEAARSAVAAGADAIGLNFYKGSRRYVERAMARQIAAAIGSQAVKVGVFVNATPAAMIETAAEVGLDLLQLHGQEPAESLEALRDHRLLRAVRMRAAQWDELGELLSDYLAHGLSPEGLLLDAAGPEHGGSGQLADWELARRYALEQPQRGWPPLVLAGGLNDANVTEAIRAVRPAAVDVASGVESEPGVKDPQRIERFVAAARAAGLFAQS